MKTGEPGELIGGTMREEDLVPTFLDELELLNPRKAKQLRADMPEYGTEEMSFFLNEDLFDALQECAPPNHYFGSHPGDGACYGFWSDAEQGLDEQETAAIYRGEET